MQSGEWQSIETFYERSDKTGPVLLYVPSVGVVRASHCSALHGEWHDGAHVFPAEDQPEYDGRAPTHWMPLPPSPTPEPSR